MIPPISSPRLLDRLPVAGQVQGLVLAGEGACVARTAHPHGLKCMDAANPADLHWGGPAAKTPSMGWGIASLGEVGYLAEGPMGVGIYHLVPPDPPHQPAPLGRIWPGGMVTHTTVHGGRLFAGLASGQVRIYDLGNPTRPELLGSFVATGPVAGMAVHGNLAMVHVVASDGVMECLLGLRCVRGPTVEIFDLGDSTAPVKVGEHDTTTTLPWAFVRSQGDRLLVPRALGLDVLMVVPTGETP